MMQPLISEVLIMRKKKIDITASTRFTMIFCLCIVVFAAFLLVFLMFFPIRMENPVNGINEKLIASAASETTVTTDVTTTTSATTVFSNTRQTTDRNRVTTTVYTETVRDNGYSPSYGNNNNNYVPPAVTQAPVTAPAVSSATEPVITTAAPVVTEPPVTEVPVQTAPPAIDDSGSGDTEE